MPHCTHTYTLYTWMAFKTEAAAAAIATTAAEKLTSEDLARTVAEAAGGWLAARKTKRPSSRTCYTRFTVIRTNGSRRHGSAGVPAPAVRGRAVVAEADRRRTTKKTFRNVSLFGWLLSHNLELAQLPPNFYRCCCCRWARLYMAGVGAI